MLGLYAVLLNVATEGFSGNGANPNWVIALLATAVVVLLASPVKNAIQAGLDRAFYRDRYDYRRALVGFARDLNSDLDLNRLAERLVSRVMETLLVDRMVLFMADDGGDFTPLRVAGFAMPPPELARRSGLGGRLEAGHVVALDDPLAARRFSEDEIEFWRDWGLFYFVPCIAKEGTIAILAMGRRDSAEPLSSEDTALLAAVAGQVATALENGRLYSQLHVKAEELDRLREFSENVLQSLDNGLVVSDPDGRILWWNRALEKLYGVPAASAVGTAAGRRLRHALCGGRHRRPCAMQPEGATLSRIPLVTHRAPDDRLLLNVTIAPLRQHRDGELDVTGSVLILEDITARVELEKQLQVSEKMASIGLLAAGVAHEVNTPLTGIASFTQMLLEGADPADQRTKLLEKIERQTFRAAKIVNGLLHLSRQGAPGANERGPVDLNAVISDVLGLLEHQLESGQGQGAPRAGDGQPCRRRRGAQASAGVPEHVPQRARRDAARRLAVDRHSPGRRPGDRRGRRHRVGHRQRAPRAHLRSVLHDQVDWAGHGPWTVDHLRHRPRARWHDARGESCRAGHALHPRVAALSQLWPGAGGVMSSSPNAAILVIDDEEIMREILETLLTREGYSVRLATSAEEGLELARSLPFDAAIVDLMLPGMDGISALEALKRINDEMPVVMITAFASVETAIAAMKRGAFDYITKPFKNDEVLVVVRNAVERNRLVQENRTLRRTVQEQYQKFANIIGRSPKMRQVFDLIIQASPSRSTILIHGESGTGKELVARAIHAHSLRADRAFVTVNSGNLPPDLLESTLFGHVKGAFTGAVYPKKGLFDLADKGSIFFDEMGNIALETQAKLLRAMQEREFMRLGGMEVIRVDVRIIAATNVDLRRMVEDGRFREDLYYRLNVISIQLPPLRDRKADIPVAGAAFPAEVRGRESQRGHGAGARGPGPADRLRLAGQRPRAGERHRAGDGAHDGSPHRHGPDSRARPQDAGVPDSRSDGAAGRHLVQGSHHGLREAPDRVHARSGRWRAETRRRAAPHQADDPQRDDQAVRHPAPAPAPHRPGGRGRQRQRPRSGRDTDPGVPPPNRDALRRVATTSRLVRTTSYEYEIPQILEQREARRIRVISYLVVRHSPVVTTERPSDTQTTQTRGPRRV